MKLTKIKTTMMAGMLAASMILPGMTAFAGQTYSAVLPITKNVTVNSNVTTLPSTAQTVPFTVEWVDNQTINGVTLAKPNNSALSGKLTNDKATVNVTVDGTAADSKISGTSNILTDDIVNAMDDVPGEYTFKITENTSSLTTDADGFGWTATDNGTYYLRCVVKNDGTVTYALTKDSVSANNSDKLDNAAFNNTYNKKSTNTNGDANTLTVKKTVVNSELVPADQTFPITITIVAPEVSGDVVESSNAYTATADKGATVSRTVSGKTVEISANVKKDETITVTNIAVGATYSVNETTSDSWQNFVGVTYNKENSLTNATFGETGASVIVENTYNSVTVTGVVTSIAPYVTLVVLAVAAVAAYMAMKSRVAR